MPSADFTIKQGDSKPSVRFTLNDDGVALDLTGTTVRFKMRRSDDDALLLDAVATLEDAPNGIVRYDWDPADLATARGTYQAEWEITYADDTVLTCPNTGFLLVFVQPDLD